MKIMILSHFYTLSNNLLILNKAQITRMSSSARIISFTAATAENIVPYPKYIDALIILLVQLKSNVEGSLFLSSTTGAGKWFSQAVGL